jgi:hypothetical protein
MPLGFPGYGPNMLNPQFNNGMVIPGMMYNQIPNQIPNQIGLGQGIQPNRQNIPISQNMGGVSLGGIGQQPVLDNRKKLVKIINDKNIFLGMDSKESKRLIFPSFKFAVE